MRRERVEETDYIFMIDEFHKLELSVSAFRVRHILKRTRQFFDGTVLPGNGVVRRAHDALLYESV